MDQKDTLLDIMLLAHKVSIMASDVDDVIDRLADAIPQESYNTNSSLRALEESLLNTHRANPNAYIAYVLRFVDKLTFVDSVFIRKTLELRRLDGKMTKPILEGLLNEDIVFFSDAHAFDYYHTLSNLAISLGDSTLIQNAIDKVQSI